MVYFSLPLLKNMRGFFLWYILWEWGWAPGEKTDKSVGSTGDLNSQNCPLWTSFSSSITVQVFLTQHWFPQRFLLMDFSCSKLWFSVSACISFQFFRQWSALWFLFSDGSKNSCWFFSFFSILLVVRNGGFQAPYRQVFVSLLVSSLKGC